MTSRPWRDRPLVEGLARSGRLALEACIRELGRLRRRRGSERWDGPVREALGEDRPGRAAALDHWHEAERAWWSLALTAERLAVVEARRHESGLATTGLGVEDLVSVGRMGLYRAAQTWRPERGSGWPSYASYGAVAEIRVYLRDRRTLKPADQRARVNLLKALDDLEQRGEPTYVPWAAAWLDIDPDRARRVLEAGSEIRLDAAGDDGRHVRELLADDPWEPAEELAAARRVAVLRRAMRQLRPRERRILEERAAGASIREVARGLGISRERVRQLERRAHDRLRPLLLEAGIGPEHHEETRWQT